MHVETNIKFIPIRLMVLGFQNVKCIRIMSGSKSRELKEKKDRGSKFHYTFLNFEIDNSLNFKVQNKKLLAQSTFFCHFI